MMRRFTWALRLCAGLCLLLWAAAAFAYGDYRVKIDRYEPASLPKVKLWVSLLAGDEPVSLENIESLSVWIDGEPSRGSPKMKTAVKVGEPMAFGILLDARRATRLSEAFDSVPVLLKKLPKKSQGFAGVVAQDTVFVPEDSDFEKKAISALPATLQAMVEAHDVGRSGVLNGVVQALERFPLMEGLEPEPGEGKVKVHDPEDPVPVDRVLVVISSGNLGTTRGRTQLETLRLAIETARRRGVRIMGIGVGEDGEGHLPLRVLSRKTGGTFRRAEDAKVLEQALEQLRGELQSRLVITSEVTSILRGDEASFQVGLLLAGEVEPIRSRDFTARVDNRMGLIARSLDRLATWWETAPWWVHLLIIGGLLLTGALIVLAILLKKAKKAKEAREEKKAAEAAALEARRPCPVCGAVLLPEWKACPFCAQAHGAAQGPKARFRLTGQSGTFAGQVLRFSDEMITLGSDSSCAVRLMGRGVSPHHCAVRERGGEWVAIDLNSQLGTLVNGQRIRQMPIGEGDVLAVGEDSFIFGLER